MYELNEFDIKELKARNYLEDDGHPSTEAYRQVFLSLSADLDQLAINIEKHGRDCPICGKATSKETLGQSMKKFLIEKANIPQETANKLWQFRQIVHGKKDLTYEDMRDLPIMANSLRQALVVLLKSALGWPFDQPPSMSPVGSGIITSYVINSRHSLDAYDIELAIRGSDFFG